VLRLQQRSRWTQVERLSAGGADVCLASERGEARVAVRLRPGAGEGVPGAIGLVASGLPLPLRDELLRSVVHGLRELLLRSFPGLLQMVAEPGGTVDLAADVQSPALGIDTRVLHVPGATVHHHLPVLEASFRAGTAGSTPIPPGTETLAQLLGQDPDSDASSAGELVELCGALDSSPAIDEGAARAVAAPQWCYRDDAGGYVEIDSAVCVQLEGAYQSKAEALELCVGHWAYAFDLQRMTQRNTKTGTERPLLRMGKESVVEMLLRGERDHQLQLQRAATQAAEELKKAQAQVAEAQTQAARAASDAERQLAARLKQEAAQRMADAARLKQEADIRVSDVKREAARQLATQQAEATRQLRAAEQAVEDARKQAARAASDAERQLAALAEREASARAAEAARLRDEAETRVAEARAAAEEELTQGVARREADAALGGGVRWLCEAHAYGADHAATLEQAFQVTEGWFLFLKYPTTENRLRSDSRMNGSCS
jgi:hypothetical protein